MESNIKMEQALERFHQQMDSIRRIERRAQLGLESGEPDIVFLNDLNLQYQQLSIEGWSETFERIKTVKDSAVSAAKAAYRVTSNFMESAYILFERDGTQRLVRAKRRLNERDGDLQGDTVVSNSSLAKRLHVYGNVPRDLNAIANSLITFSKHVRTVAAPEIDRHVYQISNVILTHQVTSEDGVFEIVDTVVEQLAQTKTLLDLYSDSEIARQYPGGLSVASTDSSNTVEVPKNPDIQDPASLALRKHLLTINRRHIHLHRTPTRHRSKLEDSRVRLIDRMEMSLHLQTIQRLIDEGKALSKMSRVFRGYSPYYLGRMADDALLKTTTDPIARVRLKWAVTLLKDTSMAYPEFMSATCAIIHDVTTAYLKLAETSIAHYE